MRAHVKLYLVRHGQTGLNLEGRFRGLTDAPLNEAGRAEAAAASLLLSGLGIERVLTSPMPRAVETATMISERTGAPFEVDPGFNDVDYGQWQGLTVEEASERFPAELASWRRDPGSFAFPGGDAMPDVARRISGSLDHAVGLGFRAVAIVSHLAILKACLVVAMGLDFRYFWRLNLDTGAVCLFEHDGEEGFVLEWWNRPPETSSA